MKKYTLLALYLLPILLAFTLIGRGQQDAIEEKIETVFPVGNDKLGRLVFQVKRCHRCHTVRGEKFPEIDLPAIANISLGGINNVKWSRDDYAHNIMDPNHLISPDHQKAMLTIGDKLAAEHSPMPDFSDILTVKDLIHLATFLEESGK